MRRRVHSSFLIVWKVDLMMVLEPVIMNLIIIIYNHISYHLPAIEGQSTDYQTDYGRNYNQNDKGHIEFFCA